MMKWLCLFVCLVWAATAFASAFDGGLNAAYFGAITGWMTAAAAYLSRDIRDDRA